MSDDDTTRLYREAQRNTSAKAMAKRPPIADSGIGDPVEDGEPDPAKGLGKTQITPGPTRRDARDSILTKKIINAAIYAAMAEGDRAKNIEMHRYRKGRWLITVTLQRNSKTDILVNYSRQEVFRAVGPVTEPKVVQTFVRGNWETELLEQWGPHPEAGR